MKYYIQRAKNQVDQYEARLTTADSRLRDKADAMEEAERLAGKGAEFFADGPGVMGYRGATASYYVTAADTHFVEA